MEFRSLLAIFSSLFVVATSTVNLLILAVILSRRRPFYHTCFFYVIYMVGIFIDMTSLASSHLLAILPSKGILLDVFLSSTTLGRIFLFFAWSTRSCQGFTNFFIALNRATAILSPLDHRKAIWSSPRVRGACFLVQFGVGVLVGVWAATSDVYWSQTSGKSWYIQFFDIPSTHIFFRFVFGLISFFSTLTIVAYVVLLLHLRSVPGHFERRRSRIDADMRNEQSLLHLAVCVCTLEIVYYLMYSYAFVMNANFELDLETFYVWYFLVTDLYSGLPPFLLLFFSTPVREDVLRLLSRLLIRKRQIHRSASTMIKSSIISYYSITSETPNITLGVLLNVLLLYLIRRYSNAYLGNYKYLLAIFASYDVFLSVLHGMLNPVVMVIGNTFGAALYAPWQNHELCSLYFACFSLPFSLMNIHFLYRYWSVADPARLKLFSKPNFVAKLCIYPAVQGTMWFFCAYAIRTDADDIALDEIQAVFFETHTAVVYDGWLVMDHWRDGKLNVPVVYVIIVTMFIIFGSLFLAICLASLTYREILKATTLSHKLISIQYTLLIAVCAQTFVPVCCVYIPYFLIIMCPFLSLPGFGLVNNFSYLVSVFPGWDAIVIMILIRDYRQGLIRMVGLRRKKKNIVLKHTQFTTSYQPSNRF